jgi:hypothetical protein
MFVKPVLKWSLVCQLDRQLVRDGNLLWELDRSDARPPNQRPNYPLRMIADIAGFDRGRRASASRRYRGQKPLHQ